METVTEIILHLNFPVNLQLEFKIKIYNHFKLQVPPMILLAREVSNLFVVLFSLMKLSILRKVRVCCGQYAPPPATLIPLGLNRHDGAGRTTASCGLR